MNRYPVANFSRAGLKPNVVDLRDRGNRQLRLYSCFRRNDGALNVMPGLNRHPESLKSTVLGKNPALRTPRIGKFTNQFIQYEGL